MQFDSLRFATGGGFIKEASQQPAQSPTQRRQRGDDGDFVREPTDLERDVKEGECIF
jgi:hypothetical protein